MRHWIPFLTVVVLGLAALFLVVLQRSGGSRDAPRAEAAKEALPPETPAPPEAAREKEAEQDAITVVLTAHRYGRVPATLLAEETVVVAGDADPVREIGTDGEGRLRIPRAASTSFELRVKGKDWLVARKPLSISSGRDEYEYWFQEWAAVDVRVVGGEPPAGGKVRAYLQRVDSPLVRDYREVLASLDDDGAARFCPLPPGTSYDFSLLAACPDDSSDDEPRILCTRPAVQLCAGPQELVIDLAALDRGLTFLVLLEGQPFAGCAIEVRPSVGKRRNTRNLPSHTGTTDEGGEAHFPLLPGSYDAILRAPGMAVEILPVDFPDARELVVSSRRPTGSTAASSAGVRTVRESRSGTPASTRASDRTRTPRPSRRTAPSGWSLSRPGVPTGSRPGATPPSSRAGSCAAATTSVCWRSLPSAMWRWSSGTPGDWTRTT